jgi:hypothetical protein
MRTLARPLLALSFLPLALLALPRAAGLAPDAPSPETLGRWAALIKPSAGEDAFDRIPWRTSLWEARQEAARLGKPILLWEMDGHPLGCT